METLLRGAEYGVIVLDSIAALIPKSELENDMEAGSMGMEQAKMMSKALRKLTAANKATALVYINQQRENIGVMFGKKTTTTGGRAMGFYAGTRLELVRTENIKADRKQLDPKTGDMKKVPTVVGHRVLVRVEKDKTGGSRLGNQTSFIFDYAAATVDHVEDLIYLGRLLGHVHKKGNNWWVDGYDDEQQNGRTRFKKWLKKNKAVQEELQERIESGESAEPDDDDRSDS